MDNDPFIRLHQKYSDFCWDDTIVEPQNAEALNFYFLIKSYDKKRKYDLKEDDDGFVYILNLIAEKIMLECRTWAIEG